MARNQVQSADVTQPSTSALLPSSWVQTVSGVAVLTIGLQGATTHAVAAPTGPLSTPSKSVNDLAATHDIIDSTATNEAATVEPTAAPPRFSQLRTQLQRVIPKNVTQPATISQSIARLESHRRELHHSSNEVESQLLGLQQLLSIQSYGTSFADQLLDENDAYQTKLQKLQRLEADIHRAIKQSDSVTLEQLQIRLRHTDGELRQIAQKQLQQYIIQQSQVNSASDLWQEPMYRESLRWLMEHTHERHLLKARQQMLTRTFVAIAPPPSLIHVQN